MIPQRVRLRGFLCYQDEQPVSFDGASLWMLAGPNGSGKSSVFDAVTYALFGYHRGGSQNVGELINKQCDKAAVEFEFTLGGQGYVALRTIQRTKTGSTRATQQLFRCGPDGMRHPIEGTGQKAGYDAWIADNIGLSFDVFTSSVMLRQGNAEKLLDAGPAGRHKVLAGIVDLERYERLHKRANEVSKGAELTFENLKLRLADSPKVTPLELAIAENAIVEAKAAQQQARAEVERLQELEFRAKNWVDLQSRLSIARQRWEQARKLLDEAAVIEQDVRRLAELRDVLPRLQTAIEQRGQIQKSEAESLDLDKHRQLIDEQLAIAAHTLSQSQRKLDALKGLIAADEQRHRETAAALRTAGTLLEKLGQYEQQEHDLQAIRRDLARMPADPAGNLKKARDTHSELTALAGAVPLLARLHAQREQLRAAQLRARESIQARDAAQARGQRLRADVDSLRPALDAAVRASRDADAQVTTAQTLLIQSRQQLDDLTQLDGAKVCRHCGQKLTADHLHDETIRRRKEVAQAEVTFRRAVEAQQVAEASAKETSARLTTLEKTLDELRGEFKERRAAAEQAGRDIERLGNECGQIWSELAEPFRQRVAAEPSADWLQTQFPTEIEVAALRQQSAGADAARTRLENAEKVFIEWNTFKGQETTARHNLERLEKELPGERQKLRGEHARLEAEDRALDGGLRAKRSEAEAVQKELDRLTQERNQTERQVVELTGKLSAEEMTRQLCRQTVGRAVKELPDSWRTHAERAGMSELFRWQNERDLLAEKQTDERGKNLQEARVGEKVMRHDLAVLEEEAEQVPAEARQEPEFVAGLLRVTRQMADQRADALGSAGQQHKHLISLRAQREQLDQDYLRAEREFRHAELLEELLSRKRLQLHLVRRAERQVVDHANAVLDRLSGGQLYLRLVGEAGGDSTAEKALELEAHNRTTGDRPINVAFLSGSQKFRVAVSLALGLGQYASKQHRPIESVIIDEGFGCLDKDGRQAMIQELHNLRGQLRCILLVSHQEEFADAFADGYRFELADGSTRVTRFQR